MPVLVTDPDLETRLIAARQEADADRYDEVWDGVYIMAPMPNNEHQDIQADFVAALKEIVGWGSEAKVCAGVNVSDRAEDWANNYRCPDVVVYLPGNPAINHGTHWQGGPDFLVEIVSPRDRSSEKLPFYAGVGVRKAMIIYRNPWALELYAFDEKTASMKLASTSTIEANAELPSSVLPISFRLTAAYPRPKVQIKLLSSPVDGGRTNWLI